MVAYTITPNLFPVFAELKVKTNRNFMQVANYTMALGCSIYSFISIVCLFLFGPEIETERANVMNNIIKEYQMHPNHWETYVIRFLYVTVLTAHIPFIFFCGKEGLLIIIDEVDRRSVS